MKAVWIFTEDLFASVVEDRENDMRLVVRFRSLDDASAFQLGMNSITKREYTILSTEKADYLFRVTVNRRHFAQWLSSQADRIRYGNFKDRVAEKHNSPRRTNMMHRIWATIREALDPRVMDDA